MNNPPHPPSWVPVPRILCHPVTFFLFVILDAGAPQKYLFLWGAVLTISLVILGLDPRIQVYRLVAKATLIFVQFGIC